MSEDQYPYSAARTVQSSTETDALLASILAASTLDEISNIEDFVSVENYIRGHGRVNGSGKTTQGLMFWLYPTGMRGPFHESREEEIELHGTLVTIEAGVLLTDAMAKAREGLRLRGIGHLHIAKCISSGLMLVCLE
ncbi:hypothetical protein CPB84DRAFT_344836 [Gymnopilus junonius]|uniref:Uncharacterized protein n=1 Tax=Gymnopilus junonius TaxID=109634 RepID=A0A9P5TRD0_GYMJU|nr:hypothetical protein CPB84DRAFT_344836 [Gymnopilus junonius]